MANEIGYIRVTHFVEEASEGGFVSFCPELGIASQGESVGEALNNLRDATYTFLNTIEQLGDRAAFFKEHGIEVFPAKPLGDVELHVKPPRQAASVFVTPVPRHGSARRQLTPVG
jgi:predicted RNase H-like HicB family nuclease